MVLPGRDSGKELPPDMYLSMDSFGERYVIA